MSYKKLIDAIFKLTWANLEDLWTTTQLNRYSWLECLLQLLGNKWCNPVTFLAEILRGWYGRRNYHLQPNYAHLYELKKDCQLLPKVTKEEDIFNRLKDCKKTTEAVIYQF